MDLRDKVIVVTGAAGGIGCAAAEFVLRCGGKVVGADRVPLDSAQSGRFAGMEANLAVTTCDVTQARNAEDLAEFAVSRFGHIDGLVNSAGVDRHHDFFELTSEQFREVMDINVTGTLNVSQAISRRMSNTPRVGRQSYSIVHLSSVNALIGTPTHTAYATSKGAIAQLTRVMAVELAQFGIRVNAVGPGTVRTPMLDALLAYRPVALDQILRRTPMGRLADVDEISNAIGFLLSDAASFITGQTLYVDGGRTVQNLTL